MACRSNGKSIRALVLAWLAAIGCGFFLLGAHHARPGRPGRAPARWPGGGPIRLDPARPTLLIFLHPRCPCSRASLAELASIASSGRGRFAAHAILYRPDAPGGDWDRAGAGAIEAAAMPDLRRWDDPGGRLARRFGVETSGHVLLFDPTGGLLFGGGITASRGHRGGNPGLEALRAGLEAGEAGPGPGPKPGPVFGCPILDPSSTSDREATR